MNIEVKTTGGYESLINGKREISNNTLANITIALLLNSIHKKELFYFAYQYAIWIYRLTETRLFGDVPFLFFHG